MRDFVVYHNPDIMGDLTAHDLPVSVVTDKKVGDVLGDRVWLLTGEGSPRSFFLHSYFIVDKIEDATDDGFETRLSGSRGKSLNPMVEITDDEWFGDFKRSQGNFGFGFQPINDNRFIEGLEKAAAGL